MREFWELLNLVEDKINHGYKEVHNVPEFKAVNNATECRDCPLYLLRNRVVYGKGSDSPKLMVIGSWPINQDEDNNEPLSGECLEFLNKWLGAMKLSPFADCYVTNLLKCKTGSTKRNISMGHNMEEEITSCFNHLEEEIKRLQPRVILTIGEKSAQVLTDSDHSLEQLRGHVHLYKGIPVVSTYHPEVALENYEALRAPVWDDLKLVISRLNG